jgi:hypothetical protein
MCRTLYTFWYNRLAFSGLFWCSFASFIMVRCGRRAGFVRRGLNVTRVHLLVLLCSLGVQAMDCRYRGNPPVLVLMADMAFECAWRLLAASWPDGVLVISDPLTGGSTSELWLVHIVGGGVFIGKCQAEQPHSGTPAKAPFLPVFAKPSSCFTYTGRSRVSCPLQTVRRTAL